MENWLKNKKMTKLTKKKGKEKERQKKQKMWLFPVVFRSIFAKGPLVAVSAST